MINNIIVVYNCSNWKLELWLVRLLYTRSQKTMHLTPNSTKVFNDDILYNTIPL